MSALPVAGVFNDGYIAEMFESWRRDPASVDSSWQQLFKLAESLSGASWSSVAATGTGSGADVSLLRAVAGASALAQAIRSYGHLAVQLDPLGTPPLGAAELSPEFHGITDADLARIPGAALGGNEATAAEVVARLRTLYCSTIGFELEHLKDDHEREWFRRTIEGDGMRRTLTADEKKIVLKRLTEVDGLERFLGRA